MSDLWPSLALVLNALVWGLSWWPFRELQAGGLHPLWATCLIYSAITVLIFVWRPAAARRLAQPSALWVLVLAAGTTNAAFNWAVSIGDVVRVVLLFYLMPLWAVLLARLLLQERLTWRSGLRVALGLLGALMVLWPADQAQAHLQNFSLADGLGLLGGFSFALNNVMVRREQHEPESARAAAMFLGGAVVAGALGALLTHQGQVPAPAWPLPAWPLAAGLAAAFLMANLALQYGASRLSAHRTAVLMLTEVLFATTSAWLLGVGWLTPSLIIGGGLILLSALLAALD